MSAHVDDSKFREGLKKADAQTRARAKLRMGQFMAQTMGNAQEGAPVDEGKLQGSGTQEEVKVAADGSMSVKGGFNTNYAAAVHELWQGGKKSKNKNPKARKKFLELALREAQPKLAAFVGKGLI